MSRDAARPLLVCLHSLGTDGAMWDPVRVALSQIADVVTPTLPGHGVEDGESFSFPASTRRLDELSARSARRLWVLGIGLGAVAAIDFAASRPDRVAGLIAVSGYVRIPDAGAGRIASTRERLAEVPMRQFAEEYVRSTIEDSVPEHSSALVVEGMVRTGAARFLVALEQAMSFDGRSLLPQVSVPTTVIRGELDVRTSLEDAWGVAELVPGGRFESMPGVGHFALYGRPEAFVARVDAALVTAEGG